VSAPAAPPRPAHRRRPAQPLPQPSGAYATEVRVEVRPRWVFRLSRVNGMDGLHRVRGGVLHRLLHRDGAPVWLRIAQTAPDRVLFGARAADRELAEWGIERMRLSTGIDQDLAPFHERFRDDPLIGASVRRSPGLRVSGRPDPFEALAWAVCEQLIEYERAAAIERRLVARLGRRCPESGLVDCPTAAVIAGQAPALLASLDLSEGRAIALVRAAREVASGRVDLSAAPHEPGWRRLRTIRGIGAWTVQCLALHGQQRLDQLPAGDLSYIKLVGRIVHGHPWGRAEPAEVEEFFAPYAPWAGLAGAHALRCAGSSAAGRMAA
jgi:3-methyladenine DNA glycosylase/8-oxoguanine DNA glycosylase